MVFDEDTAKYGLPDFVLLEPITESNFLQNLEKRYKQNRIYTFIGNVVVSMNPYKQIPELNTEQLMKRYHGREHWEEQPHVYAVAEQAYKQVKRFRKNTCILISGESGSGKTEASKIIMNYISSVNKSAKASKSNNSSEVERIKRVLLKTNVVLEAFGNAQTTRNDNSSRFGKYMDICFDFKAECSGGIINTYLLEKTRVMSQQNGERNFHIFYQLLAGAKPQLLQNLKLKNRKFKFLSNGNMIRKGDAQEFLQVQSALEKSGIDATDQQSIFQVLAAVLYLGEIDFSQDESGNVGISQSSKTDAKHVSDLLKIDFQKFELAMVSRKVRAGLDVIKTSHSKDVAEQGVKALAKTMYERLFQEIVKRVNSTIEVKNKLNRDTSIGVLDIYGFEILGKNGFEQFCINYCNEKLQQLFIQLVLKQEQEEYEKEGIKWTHIDYFDNEKICKLIEGPMIGGFDDVKIRAQNNKSEKNVDEMLVETYDQQLKSNPSYLSRQTNQQAKHLERFIDFEIKHYAGSVVYSAKGFSETNRDELWFDFKQVIATSNSPLVASLFPEGNNSGAQKRPQGAGVLFKQSMHSLVTNLKKKQPFYVRCIKPNEQKAPLNYDLNSVKHQVAYLGLLENVRVRRAGFAYRLPFDNFINRYKMLNSKTWPNPETHNPRISKTESTKMILGKSASDCVFGKTKVFIKTPSTILDFENSRRETINTKIVPFINRMWRGALARKRVKQIRAANRIKGSYRRFKLKTYVNQMITVFQSASRMDSMSALKFGVSNWPKPPAVLSGLSNQFLSYFKGWCARGVLNQLMPSEWEQVRLRCIALQHLGNGKREFCGVEGKWHGDYVSVSSLNSKGVSSATQYREASAKVTSTKNSTKNQSNSRKSVESQHAIGDFVSNGLRLNDKGKFYERTLTISESGIYKMDPAKKYKILGGKRSGSSGPAGVWALDQVQAIGLHSEPSSKLVSIDFLGGTSLVFAISKPASAVEAMVYLQKLRLQSGLKQVTVNVGRSVNVSLGKKRVSVTVDHPMLKEQ